MLSYLLRGLVVPAAVFILGCRVRATFPLCCYSMARSAPAAWLSCISPALITIIEKFPALSHKASVSRYLPVSRGLLRASGHMYVRLVAILAGNRASVDLVRVGEPVQVPPGTQEPPLDPYRPPALGAQRLARVFQWLGQGRSASRRAGPLSGMVSCDSAELANRVVRRLWHGL
jgi:hypothetical protein